MPAKDTFHQTVINALEKEGWTITDDPLSLRFKEVDLYIDLGAEKLIAAEKDGQKIAVEIKTFLGSSLITEFHTALGQFMNYRMALSNKQPERVLYLAVPVDTYETFFQLPFGKAAIDYHHLKIIVYDIDNEVITKWQY